MKALRILDYFRTRPHGRLLDLAAHAGLGPSTALRLILSLERSGAVVRHHGTREYSVGPWIFELAASTVRNHPYREFAHEVLADLMKATDETASYWIVDQHERLCIDRVLSEKELSTTVHVGTRLPLHHGAAGRVLVAFMAEDERKALVDAWRSEGVDVSLLIDTVEQVRARGFAESVEERQEGLASVAVPLLDRDDHLVAAISVSGPLSRFKASRRRAVVNDLKAAAERLTTYRLLER